MQKIRHIITVILFVLFYFFSLSVQASVGEEVNLSPQSNKNAFRLSSANVGELIHFYARQGNQRTGSNADRQTLSWMEKQLINEGYQVSLEPFSYLKSVQSKAELTFKMLKYRTIEGMTLYNSEATSREGIKVKFGETDQHGDVPIFHYYVMLPNENVTPAFLRNNHRALDELLETQYYPAVVVITQAAKRGFAPFNANLAHRYHIPIILVSSSFGNLLEREAKINKKVTIVAENKQKKAQGYNLIAKFQGSDPHLKPLIIMVSRNAWWRAASERGTGIAAWLSLAKMLSQIHPRHSLFFVALGGGELGHLGYHQFLQDHYSLINQGLAWIYIGSNIAGQPSSSLTIKTNNEKLYKIMRYVLTSHQFTNVLLSKNARSKLPLPVISFVGLSNDCYHLHCDRWPGSVNMENEMLFIKSIAALATEIAQ